MEITLDQYDILLVTLVTLYWIWMIKKIRR